MHQLIQQALEQRTATNNPVRIALVGSGRFGTSVAAQISQIQGMLLVAAVEGLPTPVILSVLMLVMAILTNIVSNNATGVIGAPIAIQVADQLGSSPEPFILAVIFGANMSYATPFGYQTNLLLLSAGGYKASDFIRAGVPLMLIMWAGFSVILPRLYDL